MRGERELLLVQHAQPDLAVVRQWQVGVRGNLDADVVLAKAYVVAVAQHVAGVAAQRGERLV